MRTAKTRITISSVAALKPGQGIFDSALRGFRARRLPSGTVTFAYEYWHAEEQRSRSLALGVLGEVTVDEARRKAQQHAGVIAGGERDPAAERDRGERDSLDAMLDNFVKRYVEASGLASAKEIKRCLDVYVRPRLGSRSIYQLTRRAMSDLFDQIEDKNGARQADMCLAILRKAFNWHMARDDKFTSPIIKGMARYKPADRARKRILADDEIRDVWLALDDLGALAPVWFPAFVRVLLLTGQRLGNVQAMHSDEVSVVPPLWTIEPGARRKLKDGLIVPLSRPVLKIVQARGDGFLFASRGEAPIVQRFSKPKERLDAEVARRRQSERRKPMPHWTFHDLRRTARSIMARYATADISERVIGHVMPGVRGVYDRYDYLDEKREALEALARHVERVVGPRGDGKVVTFPASQGRGTRLPRPARPNAGSARG